MIAAKAPVLGHGERGSAQRYPSDVRKFLHSAVPTALGLRRELGRVPQVIIIFRETDT